MHSVHVTWCNELYLQSLGVYSLSVKSCRHVAAGVQEAECYPDRKRTASDSGSMGRL